MSRPKSYRELIVWQKAMALARQAYLLSEALPKRETYGLVNQIRRAAVSVASNIAEGYGRLTDMQLRHFLGNARGSLYEMQTQIELASDLGYLDKQMERQLMDQGAEVARLINGLLTSLRNAADASRADSANRASTADHTSSANSASPASSANAHVS